MALVYELHGVQPIVGRDVFVAGDSRTAPLGFRLASLLGGAARRPRDHANFDPADAGFDDADLLGCRAR